MQHGSDQQRGCNGWIVAGKAERIGLGEASRNRLQGQLVPQAPMFPTSPRISPWAWAGGGPSLATFSIDLTQPDPQSVPQSFETWKFCPE